MIDILQAIILGTVQGLTEWLPVSSSGHLALLQLAMGLEVPVFFDLVLHIGTLTGVFAIYKKDIFSILSSIYAFFGFYLSSRNRRGSKSSFNRTDITYTRLIIIGMIPTAAIGIAFKSFFEYYFHDTQDIAIGFIANECRQETWKYRCFLDRYGARAIHIFQYF